MANAPKVPAANDAHHDPDNVPEMPDMDAFHALCQEVGAYAAHIKGNNTDFASKMAECMSSVDPVHVPTDPSAPAPVHGDPTDPHASVKDPVAAFKAILGGFETKLMGRMAALEQAQKRQFSALGIKPGAVPAPAPAEPVTPAPAAPESLSFLALKAKIQKEQNLKPGDAATVAMNANPEAYRLYLKNSGIYDPLKDPRNRRAA